MVMGKLEAKKQVNFMIWLCVCVYFFAYITRTNYTAIIVELIGKGYVTKSQAALVSTTAFITYGGGQLISGYIGDRVSPRWLIFLGAMIAVVMNVLLPVFSYAPTIMVLIWGINGFAQAFLWPPLVKVMMAAFSESDYSRAVPCIGIGTAIAAILIYLLTPLVITYMSWEYVFYISGVMAFFAALFWIVATKKLLKSVSIPLIRGKRKVDKESPKSGAPHQTELRVAELLTKFLPIIIVAIIMQGILREGITTWLPNIMSETFHMGSDKSILSGVASPLFQIVSTLLVYRVLLALKRDIFKAMAIYFIAAALLLFALYMSGMKSPVLTLIIFTLAMGLIHGVNCFQISYLPTYFVNTKSVSMISGLLNFPTYIGAAISTYLFAGISDRYGWNVTLLFWGEFAIVGGTIAVIMQRLVKRERYKH